MNKTNQISSSIIKEWHPTKNKINPSDVTSGSHKKVWWKCTIAPDHEWEARVYDRTSGKGCPCCRGLKVVKSNCLATIYPKIAKEWHPTKNRGLTPYDVVPGSNKKVWWKCDIAEDHEWEATVNNQTTKLENAEKNKCPCCCGQKTVKSNCLFVHNPNTARQWHPTKNKDLTPHDVVPGSNKKVWWKCDIAEDHEWEARVCDRTSGKGCPCCRGLKVVKSNCLDVTHPELNNQWHPTKNKGLTLYDVIAGSHKKVWWKCDIAEDHEWEAVIFDRAINKTNCPYCCGRKVSKTNCLSSVSPDLAIEWDVTKNKGQTSSDIVSGSHKKAWWKCSSVPTHKWEGSIKNRVNGRGCPYCNESKGERKISNHLNKNNIKYEREYRIKECKYKLPLPFDFSVFLKKGTLLIEYQGEQHYENVPFGGKYIKNALQLVQKRDKIKREFCLKNNIPLLEIPYWNFEKINNIIDNFIMIMIRR